MLRSSIYTASALLIGASAFAQSDMSARLRPITAPVKNGGTLNLATGNWTRHAAQANGGGPGTIYNNTCNTGYFSGVASDGAGQEEIWGDEGRLPSTSSPKVIWNPVVGNGSSETGCLDAYEIDGFQVGYCTDQLVIDLTVAFGECYDVCTDLNDATFNPGGVTAAFAVGGLPASQTLGTLACWLVTLDLNAPPQTTSLVFTMQADCDGAFDGVDGLTDTFGWTFDVTSFTGTIVTTNTGPILAGDETTCAGYDGTIFSRSSTDLTLDGTGMTLQDQFRIDGPTSNPANAGCYWFGGSPGNPNGSFHLELYQSGLTGPCNSVGTSFCSPFNATANPTGDASPCPCFTSAGQIADPGHGCGNSVFNGGGIMSAIGNADTANDTVQITIAECPFGTSTICFEGPTNILPGAIFGDGRRCAGGSLIRFGLEIDTDNDGSTSHGPATGDNAITADTGAASGSTKIYQAFYRNPNPAWCPTATFNITNALSVTWL